MTPFTSRDFRVAPTTGCWNFLGGRDAAGYGRIWDRRAKTYKKAHREMYLFWWGDLDRAKIIHHLCNNPLCINPDHLEELTNSKHSELRTRESFGTCYNGHPWIPENILRRPIGDRVCRICYELGRARERRRLSR